MSGSGQGGLGEIMEIAKQWTGLAPMDGARGMSPGIASLAGLFGGDSAKRGSANKRYSARADPVSDRTRSKRRGANNGDDDMLSSLLKSATDMVGDAPDGDWQRVVQDYVRNAAAKASGLEWLFGKGDVGAEAEARGTR